MARIKNLKKRKILVIQIYRLYQRVQAAAQAKVI